MCGNGLRCVALALASAGLASGSSGGGSFLVSTDAGLRECEVTGDGARAQVTVDMGPVRVGEALDLEAEGVALHLVRADAGNPHAVTFDAVPEEVFRRVGLAFATHAAFPRGANIELTRVGPTGLDVVVWERGVGLTLACGTGACAALAVACAEGRAAYDTPTEVRLPGGALRITLRRSDGHALMEGPARRVFTGEVFVTG
jgi:diaminopimelate epimerase